MKRLLLITWLGIALVASVSAAHAQVGKSVTIADANTIAEAELAKLPGMTATIAKSLVAKRPFLSVTVLDQALTGAGLTREQIGTLYGRIFVHINLNTASKEEILLIPGVGQRMLHEFEEYDPTPHSPCFIARSTSTSTMPNWRGWSSTCSCRSTSIQRATPTSSLSRGWGIACWGSSRSIAPTTASSDSAARSASTSARKKSRGSSATSQSGRSSCVRDQKGGRESFVGDTRRRLSASDCPQQMTPDPHVRTSTCSPSHGPHA